MLCQDESLRRAAALQLQKVPYLAHLGPAELWALSGQMGVRRRGRGECVLGAGEGRAGIYIVITGRVKLFFLSRHGREQIMAIFGPGQTFNETSLWLPDADTAYVQAIEPTVVGFLPQHKVKEIIAENSVAVEAMLRVISGRLRATGHLASGLSLLDVQARLATLLNRFPHRMDSTEQHPPRDLPLSHEELAGILGTSREVVTRALKDLELEGVVELHRRRIVIRKEARLKQYADVEQAALRS